VDYRPQGFWPEGTWSQLNANLTGVSGGNGLGAGQKTWRRGSPWPAQSSSQREDHKLTVVRDGKTIVVPGVHRQAGLGNSRRHQGDHGGGPQQALDQHPAIDAGGVHLYSAHAMRMTNSGEFIHDAPWNTGNIGAANTSHGCVGMPSPDMACSTTNTIVGRRGDRHRLTEPYTEIYNATRTWNVSWTKWQTATTLSDG